MPLAEMFQVVTGSPRLPDPQARVQVLGVTVERRHSLALRARDPGAVRLVFCSSAQAKQGLYRDSRDYPAEG
jgi:hypothetical protein